MCIHHDKKLGRFVGRPMRSVRFTPYARKGDEEKGPRFTLSLWYDGWCHHRGKNRLCYHLNMTTGNWRDNTDKTVTLFKGCDFYLGIGTAVDSDAAVAGIMGFLCLQPGDTDSEYFEHYTDQQLKFAEEHAEYLGYVVEERFGEG